MAGNNHHENLENQMDDEEVAIDPNMAFGNHEELGGHPGKCCVVHRSLCFFAFILLL